MMVLEGKARWGWKDTEVAPTLPGTSIYTSEREITERPEQLRAFLKVYQRALELMANNMDEALVLWTSHPSVAQVGLTLEMAGKMNEIYPAPKEAWTTNFSVEGLRTTEELMIESGRDGIRHCRIGQVRPRSCSEGHRVFRNW